MVVILGWELAFLLGLVWFDGFAAVTCYDFVWLVKWCLCSLVGVVYSLGVLAA